MFFSEILAKLRSPSTRKGTTASKTSNKQATPANPKTSQQLPRQSNADFKSKKELNQALENIEEAIQKDGLSDELLLQKSEILLRKGKFHKARQLLKQLGTHKNNKETLNTAQKLLGMAEQLQNQARETEANELFKKLNETSNTFGKKLPGLTKAANAQHDFDIVIYIRQEARQARTSELPKLSYLLIKQTLQAGHESAWLIHDKALSLNMMGQPAEALSLLKSLKKQSKGEKITKSINQNIERIQNNPKRYQSKRNYYLAKQIKALCKGLSFETNLALEPKNISNKSNLKSLIFQQARAFIRTNPRASLELVDSILDYNPGDLASLQLKGEALFALEKTNEAVQTLKKLTFSNNKKIANKASELIAESLAKKAKKIDKQKTAKAAITFFIQQQLKHKLVPKLSNEIKPVLNRLEPSKPDFADPELHEHQLQLLFNTMVIECLEAQMREQGRLMTPPPAQNPDAIRKTAPKAD